MLLLPLALGQPVPPFLVQVNEVLIRSILVILVAKFDTSTRQTFSKYNKYQKIPSTATTVSAYWYQSLVAPWMVHLLSRLLLTSDVFKFSNSTAISLTEDILRSISSRGQTEIQQTLDNVSLNLPSLLHLISTWSGFLHPFGLQIWSIRLESKILSSTKTI